MSIRRRGSSTASSGPMVWCAGARSGPRPDAAARRCSCRSLTIPGRKPRSTSGMSLFTWPGVWPVSAVLRRSGHPSSLPPGSSPALHRPLTVPVLQILRDHHFPPRANRVPVSYRVRSRNRRRFAVSSSSCAYRIPPDYRREHRASPDNTPKRPVPALRPLRPLHRTRGCPVRARKARAWADVARRVHRSNTGCSSADSSNGSGLGPRRGTDASAAEVMQLLTINYWRGTPEQGAAPDRSARAPGR